MFPVEKIHRDLIVNVANALHGVKQQFFCLLFHCYVFFPCKCNKQVQEWDSITDLVLEILFIYSF